MRWPHRGDKPLPCSVIGNRKQPDLAAAPRLGARPRNRIIEVTKLRRRIWIEPTRRLTGTTRVHIDDHVAVRDPHFWIRPLEHEVLAKKRPKFPDTSCSVCPKPPA